MTAVLDILKDVEKHKESLMAHDGDMERLRALGELMGRMDALEKRVDRHESATQRSISDLRAEMKTGFAELMTSMRGVADDFRDLRDSNERAAGARSVAGSLSHWLLAILSAAIGAVTTYLASQHR